MKKSILLVATLITSALIYSQGAIQPQTQKEVALENNTANTSFVHTPKAGTIIWGAGGVTGSADGEFQNAFVNATTWNPGDNPTTWTALTVFESAGAVFPGNAYWTRTLTGVSQGAYATGITAILSPSQVNGVALFDSDFMDNAGVPGAFGTGTSPSAHKGELISPRIDMTGFTDSALTVNFFCKWRSFLVNEFSLSISTDDGVTWTSGDINLLLPSPTNTVNEGSVDMVFPNATAGVPSLTACRIKFVFDGDYYYSMVDDVSIIMADEHDLSIAVQSSGGTSLADAFEQLQVTNNRYFPLSQLTSNHFLFGANVKNNGFGDVFSADSAELTVEIQEDVAGVWTTVHQQSMYLDTVLSQSGDAFIDSLSDNSWAKVGDFRTRYSVRTTKDVNTSNDTVTHVFTITAEDYASKVGLDTNSMPAHTRQIFPGGTSFQSFEYGSMFEFPTAGTEGLEVDSISFKYYISNGYTGGPTTDVLVKVYEWNDGIGVSIPDGTLDNDGSELTYVGITVVNLTGLGTSQLPGTYNSATASNLVDPASGGLAMAPLLDDKIYFVTLQYSPTLTAGAPDFTSNTGIWFGASEDKNYALNAAWTSAASPVGLPSPAKVLDAAGTGDWNWVGFGADMVPSIGVHLHGACATPTASYTDVSTGLDVTFTDGSTSDTSSVTYLWDLGDGNTSTVQNPTHTYASPGTYTVCLIVTDICGSDTSCSAVTVTVTGLQNNWMDNVSVYPIPAKDLLNITGLNATVNADLKLINNLGQVVYFGNTYGKTQVEVDVTKLAPGMYQMTINTQDQIASKSIVIVK